MKNEATLRKGTLIFLMAGEMDWEVVIKIDGGHKKEIEKECNTPK